ncbi:MAG: FeoC-like transcriptional regulator [Gammaproteobacteria bacterium]|nr:FeoC-like transcriptional regulator [Gammaproteobacteria bacterium]
MILTDIRDYLKTKGQAPLRDMALEFKMEQDALRPILEQWISKGKITKLPQGTPCGGGCNSCEPEAIELYQWID